MKGPSLKISIAVVAAVVISIAVISCATVNRMVVAPPMIPGATYVGMETCAPCHEKEARDYKLAAHARVTIPNEKVPNQGCEACHGPGSLHVEAGGERGRFTINPSKSPEACYQCHLDKQAEFNLQYHHPVREGRMSCTTCHDPHGPNIKVARGMLISRVNDQCAQCHREQARVHVFEHDAMREGCTVCHNPHGSPFDKMLVERDSNLCLKCHAQVVAPAAAPGDITLGKVNHSLFLRSGTCISGGCHTAVHGSNINPHLRY